MASVRGKSKSTCRRMRINLIDETFEEVMQWNTTQSNSSSMCETEVEHHRQNQTSGARGPSIKYVTPKGGGGGSKKCDSL